MNGKKENFTYLGGSSGEENTFAACSNNGSNVFLSGSTNSVNFPIPSVSNQVTNNYYVGTSKNYSYPNDGKGSDVFIMGLNKDFVPEWSTFYGSSSHDIFWANVAFNGFVYFVGSASGTDFPISNSGSAFAGTTPVGGKDAIISRANMNSTTLSLNNNTIKINKMISVYPNPATDKLNIISSRDIKTILVYNVTGKLVKELNVVNQKAKNFELTIENFDQGMYIIEIIDELDIKLATKFIKE